MNKALVEKFKLHNNKKEVYFRLAEQGELANQRHDIFREKMYSGMTEYLDTLGKSQIDVMIHFFDTLNGNFPHAKVKEAER